MAVIREEIELHVPAVTVDNHDVVARGRAGFRVRLHAQAGQYSGDARLVRDVRRAGDPRYVGILIRKIEISGIYSNMLI